MQAVVLFASTGLSIWAAVIARTRRGVPGGTAFSWMMFHRAANAWSDGDAGHARMVRFPIHDRDRGDGGDRQAEVFDHVEADGRV